MFFVKIKKVTLTLRESLEETKIERNEQNLKTFGTRTTQNLYFYEHTSE